jgi:hypothetical protein
MSAFERRLAKVERERVPAKEGVCGSSRAQIDRRVAALRETGFTGEIDELLIQHIIVSPPPRDAAGNIIGEAPPPYIIDEESGATIPLADLGDPR